MLPRFSALVLETIVVLVLGAGVALMANAVSPRGLSLTRDYFPRGPVLAASARPVSVPPIVSTNVSSQEPNAAEELSQRLREKGLQELKLTQAESLFHDPAMAAGQIVFVDARNQDNYEEGHIPGAYKLDPYHPEKDLGTVLPICQAAARVVVYCTGGDCEDSDTGAILLREGGVAADKIFVYGGGFNEWQEKKLPLLTGTNRLASSAIVK